MPNLIEATNNLVHALDSERDPLMAIPSLSRNVLKEKRRELLDKEIRYIQELLVGSGNRVYVCPWKSKLYGQGADYVLEISDEPVNIKLHYITNHGEHLYQNIAAAFSNCMAVWNALLIIFPGVHMRVRMGGFNHIGVPYNVTKGIIDGQFVFYIDLHQRFNMDNLSFLARAILDKACEIQ